MVATQARGKRTEPGRQSPAARTAIRPRQREEVLAGEHGVLPFLRRARFGSMWQGRSVPLWGLVQVPQRQMLQRTTSRSHSTCPPRLNKKKRCCRARWPFLPSAVWEEPDAQARCAGRFGAGGVSGWRESLEPGPLPHTTARRNSASARAGNRAGPGISDCGGRSRNRSTARWHRPR